MTLSSARSMRRDAGRLVAFLWPIAIAATLGPASAQTTGSLPNRCSRFGDGFVSVAGSDACVRIGGHVRADLSDGRSSLLSNPARAGLRPVAERRIRAGSGWSDLYHR